MIIYLVCLFIQIILTLGILTRKDIDLVGKLILCLVVILVPYMLGALFYYFYARHHAAEWFKKTAKQKKSKRKRKRKRK